jgi:hypothetical protein
MLLSPRSSGPRMLPDALPHALSLLHAVSPDGTARVEDVVVRGGGRAWDVRFGYLAAGARVEALVEVRTCERQPRPARYGFDGLVAERIVEEPGYRLFLAAEGRRLPLPDPTPRLVRDFVSRVSSGAAGVVDPAAVPGTRLVLDLARWTETS